MTDVWTTLVPLAIATAVLPIQLPITILMLRAPGGLARAGAETLRAGQARRSSAPAASC
jgi:hypothetical protein